MIKLKEKDLRTSVLSVACKRYIPSHTMNVSEALELYLKNDAGEDEQIPLIITRETAPRSGISIILDQLGRPKCSDCGADMGLRIINEPKGQSNLHGYKTCWECSKCGYEEYSLKSLNDWRLSE